MILSYPANFYIKISGGMERIEIVRVDLRVQYTGTSGT